LLLELFIVVALILINGALAMSELAVVSSRPVRLRALADKGDHRAETALRLAANPGRFLSSVQIGITLVGILSGAFSGATLGFRLAQWLLTQGMPPLWADALGVGGVVVAITYLTLIMGELVPKQIALRNPERMAAAVARPMLLISRVAAPLVWLLDISGRLVLTALGQRGESGSRISDEEIRTILAEARVEGVIETEEQEMLSGVMRLADRKARALMTPRHEVQMVDLQAEPDEVLERIRESGRPRLPVRDRDTDEVLGVLYLTDAFAALSRGEVLDLRGLIREVPVVSDQADALDIVEILRNARNHFALVYDEYGDFEGIITTGDILESITGSFDGETEEPAVVEREDGSWLVSGWMPADEFCDRTGLSREVAGGYSTVAGLVLNHLSHIPALGESFMLEGWRFEVIDLDDRRIDKLLVSRA